MVSEDLSEKVPETVFINITQIKVDNGKIKRQLSAKRAENYTKIKQTIFENVSYIEYNSFGEKTTEGKADKAIYETETENAEIIGNVRFYSYTEKTTIYAESLSWKNKEKILVSKPHELVRVEKEDGSFIAGRGFQTDFRLKKIVFANGVSGIYNEENKKEEKETNQTKSENDNQKGIPGTGEGGH
jgi:LPS export ABC transporter protein LptC